MTCFLSTMMLFADIKDAICIVEPQYSKNVLKTMKKSAKFFKAEYYDDISEAFKKDDPKSFGSGFFYKHTNNTVYVITNLHVVDNADYVNIKMEDTNGKRSTIKNCKVLAAHPAFDLAIISLPKNKKINTTLEIVNTRPKDGAEIWSAGYPGLGNEPSWQLGKGTVTNRVTRINELINPEKMTLIQHSAPVDSGNSGGPLLIKVNNSIGYAVVGINTWKAFFRQATNFAMPTQALKEFIDNALNRTETIAKKKQLYTSIQDICDLLSDYDREDKENEQNTRLAKITHYMSDTFDIDRANDLLLDIFQVADQDIRKKALALSFSTPIDALKFALAHNLEDTIYESEKKPEITQELFNKNVIISNNTAELPLELGSKSKVILHLNYEKASWLLTAFEFDGKLTTKKTKKHSNNDYDDDDDDEETSRSTKVKIESTYNMLLLVHYNFEIDSKKAKVSALDIDFSYATTYISFGSLIGYGIPHDIFSNTSSSQSVGLMIGFRLGGYLQAHVPLKFSKTFSLIPYTDIKFLASLNFNNSGNNSLINPYATFGAGLKFKLGKDTQFVISTGYNFMLNLKNTKEMGHAARIGMGIGF